MLIAPHHSSRECSCIDMTRSSCTDLEEKYCWPMPFRRVLWGTPRDIAWFVGRLNYLQQGLDWEVQRHHRPGPYSWDSVRLTQQGSSPLHPMRGNWPESTARQGKRSFLSNRWSLKKDIQQFPLRTKNYCHVRLEHHCDNSSVFE